MLSRDEITHQTKKARFMRAKPGNLGERFLFLFPKHAYQQDHRKHA